MMKNIYYYLSTNFVIITTIETNNMVDDHNGFYLRR
jgi:hypothetical protein